MEKTLKQHSFFAFTQVFGFDSTFGNGVALIESIQSGLEGVESDELHNFSEAVKILDGIPDRLRILPDFIQAVGVEQTVPGGRLVQQVERHANWFSFFLPLCFSW